MVNIEDVPEALEMATSEELLMELKKRECSCHECGFYKNIITQIRFCPHCKNNPKRKQEPEETPEEEK